MESGVDESDGSLLGFGGVLGGYGFYYSFRWGWAEGVDETQYISAIHAENTPGTTTDMAAESRPLRKENAKLKRTNEILRTASA